MEAWTLCYNCGEEIDLDVTFMHEADGKTYVCSGCGIKYVIEYHETVDTGDGFIRMRVLEEESNDKKASPQEKRHLWLRDDEETLCGELNSPYLTSLLEWPVEDLCLDCLEQLQLRIQVKFQDERDNDST